MQKTVLKFSLVLGLFVTTLACVASNVSNVPSISTLDPNAINTSIAGTMAAARTRTAQAELLAITPTLTTTPTRRPSMTPFSTYTLAVVAPQVRVAVNTNCRAGPGKQYPVVGGLLKGEVARVVGRSRDGKYWIIANPDRPGKVCWLWGGDATVTGIVGMVPVITPPPTPKPTRTAAPKRTPVPRVIFGARYLNTESCAASSEWWLEVRLRNTGKIVIRSVEVLMQDITTTDPPLYGSSDGFINKDGCTDVFTQDEIAPGKAVVVSLPPFTYDPAGHEIYVLISLCQKVGLAGKCDAKLISIRP